ncbi:hypothetical protein BV61_00660 [Candidatus Synechococcus spongiarum LMB bulk15M]|uniref:POTRA domain-containing protein n=1 Tax=Candidatus Synechococcus spongiarum LMB bulk15M TaxID=1943582 RepID=A0A1T1D3W1_9SYNE|nr:hypothetical protein BV61_00660 [Candidatus Synechococcus spongiarum LMB bulk15M]
MFNPMGLLSSALNCSRPRLARLLLGTFSATGLFTTTLPTQVFAESRWSVDELQTPTLTHGVDQDQLQLDPVVRSTVEIRRQVAQAVENLKLTQAPDGEDTGDDTEEPSSLPLEETLPEEAPDDPGREQILPEEVPSGAIRDIDPEQQVPIAEVIVVGLSGHPEEERLEIIVYDAMEVRPGGSTTRTQLEKDLTAVYATGWFSDVRIVPTDGLLGVRLDVTVTPNPVLRAVELAEQDALLPEEVLEETFAADQDKTINLVSLQRRLTRLEEWYAEQGYSLARVLGPARITPEGVVVLTVREGRVADVEIAFTNDDGETTDEDGEPIRGGTKDWVITRELSTKAGDRFNRRVLQQDLERLYGTGLFSDINVSLQPIPTDPGVVALVLKIQEAKTGSLSGGLGYSGIQGVYGQVSFSEDNLLGRAWRTNSQITYGQYGALLDLAFHDPWIKDDPYRTAFRMNIFLSREIPLQFQHDEEADIRVVDYYHQAPDSTTNRIYSQQDKGGGTHNPETTNLYYADNESVRLQRNGMNFQFIRPLNQGNPHAENIKWTASAGLTLQQVTIQDADGDAKAYAKGPPKDQETTDNFFCVGHDCKSSNILAGLRLGFLYNTLDNKTNPTSGNFASFSTEQYISVGEGSPTFNRAQFSFAHFIPMKLLKIHRGCRPEPGEAEDCPQTLAAQVTGGTLLGSAPSYESFCLGGSTSIRGFAECAVGPGTTFGEVAVEYRFPIIGIVSGELFADAGSVLGSQTSVTGNPGALLNKPDSGFSYGVGVVLNTPLGPLRGEIAKGNHSDNWRFNFGVGWKF